MVVKNQHVYKLSFIDCNEEYMRKILIFFALFVIIFCLGVGLGLSDFRSYLPSYKQKVTTKDTSNYFVKEETKKFFSNTNNMRDCQFVEQYV